MSKRIARLNEQIKREVSELIRTKVRDPRVGIVTVTGAEVARDLGSAKVWVRALTPQSTMAETLAGLEAAAPFLRGELGRLLHVRKVPELRFHEDKSMEHAQRIDEILSGIEVPPEADADEAPPADPEAPDADGGEPAGKGS